MTASMTMNIAGSENDPIRLFDKWYCEHVSSVRGEPAAFTLATSSPKGEVTARTVLLKSYGHAGFIFFTNYESRKGRQIEANPSVAMLFYWPESARQIRIEGEASRITAEESDEYFSTRPRESRTGAWASRQSSPIESRNILIENYKIYEEKFRGGDIPRPQWWGGYIVAPRVMEFWEEGPHRLHHRTVFRLTKGVWKSGLIAP